MENASLNLQICNLRPSLDRFAFQFTNDVEDANDLVQDTFIKAMRFHTLFKHNSNLKAWLYMIMRNTFINDYRKKVRKNALIQTTEDLSSYELSKGATRNQGENKFIMDDIKQALARLIPDHSVPFLRCFEGYKYHEIAKELSIPIGTVKTRIYLARQALKKQLKMYNSKLSPI